MCIRDRSKEDTALLILKQKDTTITGTVGGHESNQHPIVSGRIDGSKVTIVARTDSGNEFRLELTVRDDTMTGTVTSDGNRGELHLKKRK